MSLFSCNWQTNSWWGSKIILPSSRKHMAWFSTGRVQTGGVGRSHAVNPYSHMSFLHHEEDEEEQGGIRPKILSGLKCYFWGQFEQYYPPPPTHTQIDTPRKRQQTWGRKPRKMAPWLSRTVSPKCISLVTMAPEHQRSWVALSLNMPQATTPPNPPNSLYTWWTDVES